MAKRISQVFKFGVVFFPSKKKQKCLLAVTWRAVLVLWKFDMEVVLRIRQKVAAHALTCVSLQNANGWFAGCPTHMAILRFPTCFTAVCCTTVRQRPYTSPARWTGCQSLGSPAIFWASARFSSKVMVLFWDIFNEFTFYNLD